ncbi:MAG: iron ABC transporter permease [Verrucomicrobiota bacterium]
MPAGNKILISENVLRFTRPLTLAGQRFSWHVVPILAALIVGLPLIAICSYWLVPDQGSWDHLAEHVLADYLIHSLWLLIGVGLITGVIGVSTAWLVAAYDFPCQRLLEWALLLPLALPTYIIAFTYGGLLDEMGPVQRSTRDFLSIPLGQHLPFPEIRSLPGVIMVMSLVLYPYVYLICRAVIASQIQQLTDTARTLGLNGVQRFFRVVLPLVRPALMAGIGLAVMEALSDFGSVSFYGVTTFTTGIYRTWFNLGDLPSAARLSSLLMLFMLALIYWEHHSRRHLRLGAANQPVGSMRTPLKGRRGQLAGLLCCMPVILGFGIPVIQLGIWASGRLTTLATPEYWAMLGRTLGLGLGVAGLVVVLVTLMRFAQRLLDSPTVAMLNRIVGMGYAIPGAVLSVGILIPLSKADLWVSQLTQSWFGWSAGLILSGSLFALAYSYTVRFLAVGYQTVDAAFERTPRQLDEAALSLGKKPLVILGRIHLPVIQSSLFAAVALVLIDILKELPATLILRPFNFDTLATRTYELAIEEQLPAASIFALSIVAAGLLPIYLLTRAIRNSNPSPDPANKITVSPKSILP